MDRLESIVRAMFDAAARADYAQLSTFFAEDVVGWAPSYEISSRDEFIEVLRSGERPASERLLHLTIDVLGNKVFAESSWIGHYADRGRDVRMRRMSVFEFEDGAIKRFRQYWDNLGAMRQLGLLPE